MSSSASRFPTDGLDRFSARQSARLLSQLTINDSPVPRTPDQIPSLLALRPQLPKTSLSTTCTIVPTLAPRLLNLQTTDTHEVDQSSPSSLALSPELAKPLLSDGRRRVRSRSMLAL